MRNFADLEGLVFDALRSFGREFLIGAALFSFGGGGRKGVTAAQYPGSIITSVLIDAHLDSFNHNTNAIYDLCLFFSLPQMHRSLMSMTPTL